MKIFLLVLLLLVLLLLTAGYAAFFAACVRLSVKPDPGKSKYLRPYAEKIRAGAQWFQDQGPERVQIRSDDGLRLTGYFLPAKQAKGTLLLVHGYRSDPFCDFGYSFDFYASLGWNILAVCQRAHGESEGKFITYGVKERYDVRDWALYLTDRFGPSHRIALVGISMGSATVLMSLGTALPDNVKCAIADCGYTSPYEQFVHMLKTRYHLPCHPLLEIADAFSHLFAGFGFKDYSTVQALRNNQRPVLFAHGEKDAFVPIRFTVENYAACAAEKRLITVPEAGHGTSYVFATETCQNAIRDFLRTYAR